jgi:hypothetical protein
MTRSIGERNRLALLGWLATVAMSLSFVTAVRESRYIFLGAVTSLVLVLAGIGLRALRLPTFVVVLGQLALLTELLLWGFGRSLVWGLVPTGATWAHIDELVTGGIDHAQEYPAPAPPDPGLLLMLVFFIAVIAVLVDLAISVNRVPLAGLPLLALYTVPVAALPDGVPFVSFLAGAAAYVGLLTAAERERLAHWGRLVAHGSTARSDDAMDTRALRSNGQRIAVLALAASVLLPIFIPTMSSSLLDDSGRLGTGDGRGSDLRFNDPMVSLASALRRDEEVDLLEVDSDVAPSYLRMTVLDEPGPNAWSSGTFSLEDTEPISSVLPAPTGMGGDIARTPHVMTVRTTGEFPSNSTWFPVPFGVTSVALDDDDWAYFTADQTVVARVGTAASRVEEVAINYARPEWTAEQLGTLETAEDDIMEQYGDVPDDIPVSLINQARAITAGATSDHQRAELLQSYFRDPANFDYDLDVGYGYGYEAMVEFLKEGRGFCQQFAATMAMMARVLGIPSRVVTGFLNPTRDEDGYVFTSHDMHAWPELYFPGSGWVRFEPTPGVGAALPAWAPDANPTVNPGNTPTLPTPTSDDLPDRPTATDQTSAPGSADPDQAGGGSSGTAPSAWWLVLPVVAGLLFAPALTRRAIRRRRLHRPIDEGGAAEAAWLELRDRMRDLRMPWQGSMTPRTRERVLAPLLREDGPALAALHRLAMSVERARYATSPLPDADPGRDAMVVMEQLDRTVSTRQRVRAWWWPSSLMPDLARGWAALRERLRRRPAVGGSEV